MVSEKVDACSKSMPVFCDMMPQIARFEKLTIQRRIKLILIILHNFVCKNFIPRYLTILYIFMNIISLVTLGTTLFAIPTCNGS